MAQKKNSITFSVAIQTRETPLMILKRCIQCVREQTLPDIEIILLDSNDEDSPYKEAIRWEEGLLSDIIYLEIPEEGEFINGKNAVLEAYHGAYLTFLSAQDIMPPKRLEEALSAFLNDRSINVLYTDISAQQTNILDQTDLQIDSKEFHYLPQLIFHRDCFDWIGSFDTALVAHCDDDIWLRVNSLHLPHHLSSEDTKVVVCPECYHQYTPLNAAIGYRQLLVKYTTLLQKNIPEKKRLYQKAASAYPKAGVLHRYVQFQTLALFTRKSNTRAQSPSASKLAFGSLRTRE